MKKEKSGQTILNKIEKSPDIPNLVARQIIELIASGKLKPGDKLPSEHDMTKNFGISRISLREAMKLLEAKGYIESHGRRGKFVKYQSGPALESTIEEIISVDHEKIWELLSVRRIIDSEAARMAAQHATKAQIALLKKFKSECEKLGVPNLVNTKEGGKLYARLYNDLADATSNTIFAHLMKLISSLLKGALPYSRQKLMAVPGVSEIFYNQHVKILAAIEKGDARAAGEATIEHIDWLEKTLKKILK
ncbi:MAG: FadR family transcriptional regulator [Spirochaetes bacterium]|nr:FadR family transcriptional regulator [Spirochaetota bacterium]